MIFRQASSVFAACLLVSACQSTWTPITEENAEIQLGHLHFTTARNWMIYNDHFNNYGGTANAKFKDNSLQRIMLSKNGFGLDIIDIIRFNAKRAFPSLKRGLPRGRLPIELVELYIAEQKALTGVSIFTITRNEPREIAKQEGFLLQFHYRNSAGLFIEQMTYGFADGDYFYVLSFRAPSLHFFDAGIKDFVRLLDDIKLTTHG
ncbi:MAG: hypothetical protein ACC707_21190 [Thiohalomonadales bacterium]